MNSIDISGLKYNTGGNSDIIVLLGKENYKSELSEDYIIPDYISDVKKVLHTFARPKTKSRYINGSKLIFDGEVIYTVLLLTEDGAVKSVTLTSPYNNTAEPKYLSEINDLDDNYILSVTPAIENIECRLLNPRKINVKAKLSSHVCISRRESVVPQITGLKKPDDESGVERNVKPVPSLRLTQLAGNEITLSEDIELDAALPPVKEILFCGVDINFSEYRHVQDKINAAGEATIVIIYTSDSGDTIAMVKRIPVTASLDADKITSDCEFFGGATVGTIKTNIENNSYGESRIIELDTTYNIDLFCVSNETADIMQDIYSVDYECESNYKDIDIYSVKRCLNTNFSVNAGRERREIGAENVNDIIFSSAAVNIDNVKQGAENGRLTVEGTAEVSFIVKAGDEGETSHIKYSVPLKFEPDIGNMAGDFEYVCRAASSNVRGRLDSGYVYCDFEVLLGLLLIDRSREHMVGSATFNTSHPVGRTAAAPIILYYPQPGEQLWDIAKHYNTTCDAISAANNIKAGKITDQRVLIIPRQRSTVLFSKII